LGGTGTDLEDNLVNLQFLKLGWFLGLHVGPQEEHRVDHLLSQSVHMVALEYLQGREEPFHRNLSGRKGSHEQRKLSKIS